MKLTKEEQNLLDGGGGAVVQKIIRTLVEYGRAMDADRFVDLEWPGHFAIPCAIPGLGPRLEMLDELAEAGLTARHPFTLDPRPPLDFENLDLSGEQIGMFKEMYGNQERYDRRMLELGLRDDQAYTCTPYMPEVGREPRPGAVMAWSESSCIVYANSVLGARTNRNAAILDLLSNLLGKTPRFGLLTDRGRRASWFVQIKTNSCPPPQLLGAVIGRCVMDRTPYIAGLSRFLDIFSPEARRDYLKEMGAACASIGAVGLFHLDGITPEAVSQGLNLLEPEHQSLNVTDGLLEKTSRSFKARGRGPQGRPRKCLIGCPHLSCDELRRWSEKILTALKDARRSSAAVRTILFAAPQVLSRFKAAYPRYEELIRAGIRCSPSCAEAYLENPLCAAEPVVTDSFKLSAFTSARLVLEPELVEIIAGREVSPDA